MLVRPEALEQRKLVVLVKPESISDMVSVVTTSNVLEYAPKRVRQYLSVIVIGIESHSFFDVLPDHVHKFLAGSDGKS